MGILIGLDGVGHEWPGKRVLEGQTLGVYEGDRIGVVGRNGEGKSTLLELASRRVRPDSGTVTWRNGISVGVLAQDDELDDEDSVIGQVAAGMPEYAWAGDPRRRAVLAGLLSDVDLDARVGTLSGGQRRRVDLARLLFGTWDVLCLDEPTNHLDVVAISWLAEHLRTRWPEGRGALLVVTHDRWFLDEVCTSMWEVHDRRVDGFEGGFSAYVQQRVERERLERQREERRQNALRRELAWLSRGAQARTSKPRFRIEEARALIADVPPLRNPVQLKQLSVARLGKQVIECEGVSCELGGRALVRDLDWIVGPGDRVGILGANGAGKTTLLRLLTGSLAPTRGRVRIGATVRFGVLSQRLESLADKGDWRVRDLLRRHRTRVVAEGREWSTEQLLEMLGFDHAELMTPVGELSGGQRRRLALLLVLVGEPNVLVLDEPGNDMDTEMLAVMEDLLDGWPGTLVMVTHDRYLMERVVDDEYALLDGMLRHLPRGVDEYLELEAARSAPPRPAPRREAPAGPAVGEGAALSNQERRELKRRKDSVERRIAAREGRPDELRAEMRAAEPTDYQELERIQAELDAAEAELAALEDEWLELSERLGE